MVARRAVAHGRGDEASEQGTPASTADINLLLTRAFRKVFCIHPLTTEDIQMEETREKIELFRNYYLVCFRSFEQDNMSPTYLEPLNMYIIVFREGIISVRGFIHFVIIKQVLTTLHSSISDQHPTLRTSDGALSS